MHTIALSSVVYYWVKLSWQRSCLYEEVALSPDCLHVFVIRVLAAKTPAELVHPARGALLLRCGYCNYALCMTTGHKH